jgi:hypothetical protein
MTFASPALRARLGAVLAVLLLVMGILVNLGFTRRQEEQVKHWAAERSRLREKLAILDTQDDQGLEFGHALGAQDLDAALAAQGGTDAVAFIGRALDRARLNRLELSTTSTSTENRIRRTKFFLRATGSYGRVIEFLHSLEQGPRLVTVESLVLQEGNDPGSLEARVELTIYELMTGP